MSNFCLLPFAFCLLLASCRSENQPPMPVLEISPYRGNSLTVFHFDASKTTDRQNYALSLEIRWDWDGDGSWDTEFSSQKEEVRRFSGGGCHRIRMQVVDNDGLTAETKDSIYLFELNMELGSIVDPRDGQVYHAARINHLWIMTENLRFGRHIPDSTEPSDNDEPEYYFFNNDAKNADYGGLYTWDEAMDYGYHMDSQGICPPGWHIPSSQEWKEVLNNLPNHGADMTYYLGPDCFTGFNLEFYGFMNKKRDTGFIHYPFPGYEQVAFWCSDPPGRSVDREDVLFEYVKAIWFNRFSWFLAGVRYRPVNPENPPVNDIWAKYFRCIRDEQ